MILELTIEQLSQKLEARELSATEVLNACLERIEATKDLNAFVHVDERGARAAALAADDRIAKHTRVSALDGVPIALKDNFVTEGVPTTAGSKILSGWIPPYDGTTSRRLKNAGAVMVGKTNLDEFAMGSSSEHTPFGAVKNPHDPSRVAGGSSGGSATAVASNAVFGSFGTDTGGSIRQPAALTGIYGLKPTYGRVSRSGIVAYASSLDQVGPFAKSSVDLALLLGAVAGFDPQDSTSVDTPVPDYAKAMIGDLSGKRVGLPKEYFVEGLEADVRRAVEAQVAKLKDAGAEICEISLPHTKYALSTYYLIAPAEAASNLARYDGVRYGARVDDRDLRRMIVKTRHSGFGDEVKRRIMLGTFVLSAGYYDAYYGRAQKVRTLIRRDFEHAFGEVDLIFTPTSPFAAFELGSKLDDPLAMYLADVFTLAVNLAGVPGLSVPAGKSSNGLPIGAQIIGRWFEEDQVLRAAHALETRK